MRRYTWKPDVPDWRDHLYRPTTAKLPELVDLRPHCSPVEDQGDLGSCTAQALAGALEYLERRVTGAYVNASRLFAYYCARRLEGSTAWDAGAEIRSVVKAAAKLGVCHESLWRYVVSRFADEPPDTAWRNAMQHRISQYQRITSLEGLRSALAEGFPVLFGFMVYASFESRAVARSGTAPMPAHGEEALGGHAVLAVGYDDKAKRVLCRNSWGRNWGQKGYFTLPYAYVANRDLSDDFWTVRK